MGRVDGRAFPLAELTMPSGAGTTDGIKSSRQKAGNGANLSCVEEMRPAK